MTTAKRAQSLSTLTKPVDILDAVIKFTLADDFKGCIGKLGRVREIIVKLFVSAS